MQRTLTYYGDNYANLPLEMRGLFETINITRTYLKGELIYSQGDLADYFYYLKKGQVKIFLTSTDGLEKTIAIIGSGSILGEASFFDGEPRISSAKVLQNSEIITINKQTLMDKIRLEPSFAVSMLKLQAQSIRLLSSQLTSVTFLQADCRIARLLTQAKLTSTNPKDSYVHLTHEEIGNIVGVSRVTVSKILNSFAKEGYLETSYGNIKILDIKKLEDIANFD